MQSEHAEGNPTVEPTSQTSDLGSFTVIGEILPDLFAVFDLTELRAIYVNPAGMRLLDPQKRSGGKIQLTEIIGINCIDRFHREIFPQTRVLGSWTGSLVLRDLLGCELACRVKFREGVSREKSSSARLLYLYASASKDASSGTELTASDQEMLHALLETTPDRVTFKDLAGRYLRISRVKAFKHNIADPREAIGKTDFDFFTIEHAAKAFQEEQAVIKTGEPIIDHEERMTYDDGRVVWASTTRLPFRNREGKLVGTFCMSRDITARKQAEDAIRKSEAVLRGTFTAAPVGIALVESRVIRKVNDFLCEISGYAATAVVGQPARFLYHDEAEYDRVGRALYEGLQENSRTRVETIWRRADGTSIEVLLSAALLDTDDSQTWRIVTVFDMTDSKRAERALREKEQHLSEAQRIAHLGSWKTDLVSNELIWSDETRRIFGWPTDIPVPVEEWLKFVHPDDRQRVAQHRADAIANATPIDSEYRILRADGELRYVRVYGIPSVDAYGRPTKLEGTVLDVTDQRTAQAERREMEARLQLAQKLESVGMLAAGVAHEINTPTQYITDNARFLTGAFEQISRVIASYQDFAKRAASCKDCTSDLQAVVAAEKENELEYLVGEIPRTLEQSLQGLQRISRIVSSLKEFSHPNAVEKSVADLNRAIETTIAVSRHEWKYVADVVTELDPTLPRVNCVLDEFNQAILNLIINAAHAIGDANKQRGLKRGQITVRTRQETGWVIVEVEDTGTGIAPEVKDQIFQPFFTTKGIGKGTGQGLAIVHAVIVKGHGGRIDVTTEVGRGSTFRISLPHAGASTTPPK